MLARGQDIMSLRSGPPEELRDMDRSTTAFRLEIGERIRNAQS